MLCIDELDKLLRPELPNKATSQQQALWKIKVQRLPRMERKEDMQFLNEYGFTLTEAVLCGFIPAQLIDFHLASEMRSTDPEHLFNQLNRCLRNHSQAWEFLVAIALVLHRLAATVMDDNCLVAINRCNSSQIGFLVVPGITYFFWF